MSKEKADIKTSEIYVLCDYTEDNDVTIIPGHPAFADPALMNRYIMQDASLVAVLPVRMTLYEGVKQ